MMANIVPPQLDKLALTSAGCISLAILFTAYRFFGIVPVIAGKLTITSASTCFFSEPMPAHEVDQMILGCLNGGASLAWSYFGYTPGSITFASVTGVAMLCLMFPRAKIPIISVATVIGLVVLWKFGVNG